jgi:hypothetical protein
MIALPSNIPIIVSVLSIIISITSLLMVFRVKNNEQDKRRSMGQDFKEKLNRMEHDLKTSLHRKENTTGNNNLPPVNQTPSTTTKSDSQSKDDYASLTSGPFGAILPGPFTQTDTDQLLQPKPLIMTKYSPIPEDGRISLQDLQLKSDSYSYLEIELPVNDAINKIMYRYNTLANHEIIIGQGIDRLENAFSFAKPTSSKVNQVKLIEDGVLVKEGCNWLIKEKARIEFK